MKRFAMIPARYAASRFPGKLMQKLGGKTVIRQTYERTVATKLFDDVIVATDSPVILDEIIKNGGKAILTVNPHESGTDRISEACEKLDIDDHDLIVNVQGDEPFVHIEPLKLILDLFEGPEGKDVRVASLIQVLENEKQISDPNFVKVVVDKNNNALLFSRSVIPYPRNKSLPIVYYEHIGVYGFRKEALMQFSSLKMTPLEAAEKIECLRFLENGIPIKMAVTSYMGVEIDTPEDLANAERILNENV